MAVVGIVVVSTLPYFHDVITDQSGTREGIPIIGAEELFTDSQGKIMGFSSYRIFLYTLMIYLFAHIGFVGWMMDAKGKFYRIALAVPVILSGYTVAVILFNAKETTFNSTSTKFYITIAATIGVLAAYILDHRSKLNLKKGEGEHAGS
ncbi:hypothetical protein BFP75_00965 [Maribacter sp. 4G9]|nr:hypothetical protein BFP75_00965 [Maribacter sp. 4G9]